MSTGEPGCIRTDVLVVGSGPTGATMALLLARHGLDVTVVTRSGWVSDSPRAHITNQRTVEVLRAVGLEEAVQAQAAPRELMANHVLCTTLAGEEIGRVWSWGNDPERQGEYATASPVSGLDIPQDRLEPILVNEAARLGARLRFNTTFEELEQDDHGVTARVTDLASGRTETIRATYLIGADGGRSRVAQVIGLPLEGTSGVAGAMNVRFTADLAKHVAHRAGSLYEIIQPHRPEALAIGMLRMVRPWHDWVAGFVHLGERNSRLTEAEALEELRELIGDDSVDITITGLFPWRVNHVIAGHYSVGRVFCAGDAVHRHPPMNGLGANTCIQDAFNLAWKLAMVLKGAAGAGLLETYSAERQPVGKQIVDRAINSWHLGKELIPALGIDPTAPQAVREAQFAVLKEPSRDGELRRAEVARALEEKAYVFGAHGVEMNQRYESAAVVGDGTRSDFTRDPQLYVQPTSDPGARLPHAWVGGHDRTVSTLDLTAPERFTLLTRVRGAEWVEAARTVAEELGIDLLALRIGPGGDVADLYGDFARRSGIDESGCLLVRPDQHVAWRCSTGVEAPAAELRRVLGQVLDRPVGARAFAAAAGSEEQR
ncbi:FAD-dependent monooxygenase [Georgenia yuyongxinii]|uniref:2,4-dichlorophenol 6-monooxygenase n=1 Tax=Georgenia yuyongxinii TaxID=2589797 RepID=A0A552WWQ5_9MICO|nr:FAD-dependent monooxygenase [Georgenia yuyongxinii]TRW47019.1 2,4-dichlorophenol 6-monooxygenase [Georgenia yuyongxinii]